MTSTGERVLPGPGPRGLAAAAPWLLLAVAVAVWWPALAGDAVYDDELNLRRNASLRAGDLAALCTQPFFREQLGYWRPASSLLLALGHQLAGIAGVHALSLLVHWLAATAAFRIGVRVLGDERSAFAAAALFLVHPVHVESVAWASALSIPLWSFAALRAVGALLPAPGDAPRPWRAAAWTGLALLANENGATAVLLLFAVAVCVRAERRELARLAVALGAVCAVWILLRAAVLPHVVAVHTSTGGVPGLVVGAGEVMLRSLGVLLVPWPLTPFRALHAPADASLLPALFVAAGAIAAAATWRRWSMRARIAAVLLVVPLVLPAALHRWLGDYPLADRYLYLPALGLAFALVAAVRGRLWLLAVPAAAWTAVAIAQMPVWRDQRALVEYGVRCSPADANVRVMLGNLHFAGAQAGDAAQIASARRAYTDALALPAAAPRHATKARAGLAWCDLLEQEQRGRVDAAMLAERFRQALDDDDAAVGSWVGLGIVQALAKKPDAAARAFRRAIELDAACPEAWFNLAYLQLETGRRAEARASLERALHFDPDLREAADLLARLR